MFQYDPIPTLCSSSMARSSFPDHPSQSKVKIDSTIRLWFTSTVHNERIINVNVCLLPSTLFLLCG